MMKKASVVNVTLADTPLWHGLNRALKRFGYQQDALIEVLHIAQETFGYLSPPVLEHIARELKLPLSWVYGVASFYHFFSLQEAPEHTCVVCTGTACHVEGANEIVALLEIVNHLGNLAFLPRDATADGFFDPVDFA